MEWARGGPLRRRAHSENVPSTGLDLVDSLGPGDGCDSGPSSESDTSPPPVNGSGNFFGDSLAGRGE